MLCSQVETFPCQILNSSKVVNANQSSREVESRHKYCEEKFEMDGVLHLYVVCYGYDNFTLCKSNLEEEGKL